MLFLYPDVSIIPKFHYTIKIIVFFYSYFVTSGAFVYVTAFKMKNKLFRCRVTSYNEKKNINYS